MAQEAHSEVHIIWSQKRCIYDGENTEKGQNTERCNVENFENSAPVGSGQQQQMKRSTWNSLKKEQGRI